MLNLARLFTSKLDKTGREQLMQNCAHGIRQATSPLEIIFFGSITTDKFDEYSDVDVIAIYPTLEMADKARRLLYSGKYKLIDRPTEILCVDKQTFDEKSVLGGVYFIAATEGIRFKQ